MEKNCSCVSELVKAVDNCVNAWKYAVPTWKGKKKLSSTLSDKYPPFVMLKERGKVLHPNVCCGAPLFVSVASLLKGRILKKCRLGLRLLHTDSVEYLHCKRLKKQLHKRVTSHVKQPRIHFIMGWNGSTGFLNAA